MSKSKATNRKSEAAVRSSELVRPLRGLEKVCKLYGRMKCGDVMMAWDYANDCAIPEKELRADKARWAASEKAKWSNAGTQRPGASDAPIANQSATPGSLE